MAKVNHSITGRVVKALGVFGSIEVISMACAVVRTKLVALWIGAAGVGVISLFNATLELLKGLLQLNLRQSAVREIAAAPAADRPVECSATRRCGLVIGIVSAIVTAALSPLLSLAAFGSYDYAWSFVILATTMVATAVAAGRSAILQGLGMLRQLARATMWAALTSTAAAIALFYFFRFSAIVPVLVIFPFSTLLFLLLQPVPGARTSVDTAAVKAASRRIIRMGGWLTVAAGTGLAADYALRVWLGSVADIDTVGLFQAGFTIVNTYIGVVFTAISMEFYPRLSSTIGRPSTTRTLVSHEIMLVTWILLPVIVVFMALDRVVVGLLYSGSFYDIIPYVSVAVCATTLRGASWCMAYVILAKGDGRAYVVTEALSCAIMLGAAIPLWHAYGFVGLGVAYVVQYMLYMVITAATCRLRYGLALPRPIVLLTVGAPLVAALALWLKLALGWAAPLVLLVAILPLTFRAIRR